MKKIIAQWGKKVAAQFTRISQPQELCNLQRMSRTTRGKQFGAFDLLHCATPTHTYSHKYCHFFTHYLTFSTVVAVVVAVNFHLRTRQHFTVVVVLIVAVVGCYTHHVSKLLNFLVTTLPRSMPRRSTMRCARSGCEVPENTLMFGILECIRFRQPACFSKLSRIKLLARIGLAERTGITQSTSTSFYYKNFFAKAARQRQRRRRTRERDWEKESAPRMWLRVYVYWQRERERELVRENYIQQQRRSLTLTPNFHSYNCRKAHQYVCAYVAWEAATMPR